jgi:hypothetical protein
MISNSIKQLCTTESQDYFLTKHSERVKELGEVFTPTPLVLEMLEKLPDTVWEEDKTFLDPTVGNGQFLAAVLITKLTLGHNVTKALKTLYGVDIMQDNVDECRERLLDILKEIAHVKITKKHRDIVKHNILCKDGLKYDYSFGDSPAEKCFEWDEE